MAINERHRKMLNKKETLAVIITLLLATACLASGRLRMREHSKRILCSANLKNIAHAITVYRNDFEGNFPKQESTEYQVEWAQNTPDWQNPDTDWNQGVVSIGASLYLLVRNADIPTSAFVCPDNVQTPYDGTNSNNLELTELRDFGNANHFPHTGPVNCVSYAYHSPLGRYSTNKLASPGFAVMADQNPWYDSKLLRYSGGLGNWLDYVRIIFPYWEYETQEWAINIANSYPHDRAGQNVLFADSHINFEKTSDVGIDQDNIYTPQDYPSSNSTDNIRAIRRGATPGSRSLRSSKDSFLLNDDRSP